MNNKSSIRSSLWIRQTKKLACDISSIFWFSEISGNKCVCFNYSNRREKNLEMYGIPAKIMDYKLWCVSSKWFQCNNDPKISMWTVKSKFCFWTLSLIFLLFKNNAKFWMDVIFKKWKLRNFVMLPCKRPNLSFKENVLFDWMKNDCTYL